MRDKPALIAVAALVLAVAVAAIADGVFTPSSSRAATTARPATPSTSPECARTPKRCREVDMTIHSVVIQPAGPGFSGSVIDAGRASGTLGDGLSSITATFPTPETCVPTGCPFDAGIESYFPRGGLRGKMTGVDKLAPDGTASAEGAGEIVSGTFGFKGVHGHFTFTSTTPSGSHVTTIMVRGMLVFGGSD